MKKNYYRCFYWPFLLLLRIFLPPSITNPAIGVMMSASNFGDPVYFSLSIKNIGDEALTNIYLTQAEGTFDIQFNFSPVALLAPGEEIFLSAYKPTWSLCYDTSQVIVL